MARTIIAMSRATQILTVAVLFATSLAVQAEEYRSVRKVGPAEICLQLDSTSLSLSGEGHLTLTVDGLAPLKVELARSPIQSPGWRVQAASVASLEFLPGGRARWQQTYNLFPRLVGALSVQLAPLRFTAGDSSAVEQVHWEPIPVRVETVVEHADLSQVRDITAIEDIPPPPPGPRWKRWLGLVLLVASLLATAWVLRRRAIPSAPLLTPVQWAFRELERIDGLQLPQGGEMERYHTLLSDVVRRYLEMRYDLRAPRQTTQEFLETLRQSPLLRQEQQDGLRDFLHRCDLAKFARAQFSEEESRAAGTMARQLVTSAVTSRAPSEGNAS